MNVSGPVRVFALLGAVAALGLGAWFFLLGGMSPTATSEPLNEIKPLYAGKKGAAVRAPAKARSKPAPKTTNPAVKVAPAPKPKHKPRPKAVKNPNKLPLALARALARHPVVVVSLYDPEAKVDRISLGEARAGAVRAGAGFVALNVLDRRSSEALTRKFGVLSAPAFFLYRRPGELVMRIDGFADRDLVAQAAASSLPHTLRASVRSAKPSARTVTQARWSARANAICRQGAIGDEQLATRGQIIAAAPRLLADIRRSINRLKALPLPTAPAARTHTRKLLAMWNGLYALEVQMLDAVKTAEATRLQALVTRFQTNGRSANRLAADLGATTCTVSVG